MVNVICKKCFIKIITWKSANLDEEKMMELVNMHWKPVYINCGPCKQRLPFNIN